MQMEPATFGVGVPSAPLEKVAYQALEQAAEQVDESVSEFVRRAVQVRVGGGMPVRVLPNTSLTAQYTHTQLSVAQSNTSALRNLVQDEFVREI